jgi:hypothetical protein
MELPDHAPFVKTTRAVYYDAEALASLQTELLTLDLPQIWRWAEYDGIDSRAVQHNSTCKVVVIAVRRAMPP